MTGNAEWPEHDSKRWGVRWVDAGQRQSVRRVSDLIRCRTDNDTPLSETATGVIDELARLLPEVSAWSILDPKGRPALLSAEDEWTPNPPNFHGREYDSYPEWKRTAAGSDWAGFAEAHAAIGLHGVLLCLRSTFAHAACAADLDNGIAARIAIPEAVALQVARLASSATAATLVANGSDAMLTADPAALATSATPDATAPTDRRLAAVAALRKLEADGRKSTRQQIASQFNVSVRTVGKWIAWVDSHETNQQTTAAHAASYLTLQA